MHSQKQHIMSKEAQRPPRYPLQKKSIDGKQPQGSDLPGSCIGLAPQRRHCRSSSESFIDEEKPPWFDDLLNEQDLDSYSGFNMSTSSCSLTFLDLLNEIGLSISPISSESDDILESSCTYGPNSPKRRSHLTFPVSSAFSNPGSLDGSENAPESKNAGLGTLDRNGGTNDELGNGTTPIKRLHPGQQRRAWKMQYIAELERTVSILQTFESELAIKVAVLFEQRCTLQMENSKLKKQMIKLQQEKLLADGQYKYLRKEAEMLKARFSRSHMNKISTVKGITSLSKLVG